MSKTRFINRCCLVIGSAILALILFALPLSAQTFVQGGSRPIEDPKAVYTFTFPKPNVAPCTLFASVRWNQALPISDSNGNTWTKVPGNSALWYTTSCAGGTNTITVTYPQPSYFQAVFAEYSGVLIPDQVSNIANGSGVSAASPFIPATAGELLIGTGWNDNSNYDALTANFGFTLRANASGNNVFLQDMIQPSDGSAVSSVTYASADDWHQAIAAFKVSGVQNTIPLTLSFPGSGSGQGFTITVNQVAVPSCNAAADGDCSLALQISAPNTSCSVDSTNTITCSGGGTLAITKTSSLPTPQVVTTIIANVKSP